jgi:hypothetical protein
VARASHPVQLTHVVAAELAVQVDGEEVDDERVSVSGANR